jgi:hypothetical protein
VHPLGSGTERVEETLAALFPDHPVERFDRDVLRASGELTDAIDRVHSGAARILIGTQMLTKGHHFPDVTLVVVPNADQSLFATDFRAAERLAQTIVQVAGRAGRADRPGEVLIQSQFPDNPLLKTLLEQGYAGFAATALAEREAAHWPPFARMALLRASDTTAAGAMRFLDSARTLLAPPAGVVLQPPVPASLARRADRALASIVDARRRELRALRAELLEPAHALSRARHRVDDLLHRASAGVRAPARRERERLDRLRARLSRQEPRRHLRELIARMEGATRRLGAWQAAYFRREGMRLERLQARLEPANVAKLLARGFALVLKDGRLVSKSGQVGADDAVRIALAQGWIDARVTSRDAGEDPLPGRGRPAGGDTSSGGSVDPHFRRR